MKKKPKRMENAKSDKSDNYACIRDLIIIWRFLNALEKSEMS